MLEHVGAVGLPGCGAASGCARATSGPWGRVPGLGWPISYLGLAYFAALLVAWPLAGNDRRILIVVRLGAALSVLYVGVMLVGHMLCPYCLTVHAANLGFWVLSEALARRPGAVAPPATRRSRRWVWAGAAVFLGISAALGVLDQGARKGAAERAERDLSASTARISAAPAPANRFEGRYRLGPERSPIRLVLFTDYQCPDCRGIEGDVRREVAADPRIAVSIKHFPFCIACNPGAPDLHPNACWAARAAEAAGILGGPDGFWRMHHWLFDRSGAFTDGELSAALPGLGFEGGRFLAVMMGDETLARVRADIDEGLALGLSMTPMIFINGVELKGWSAPDAVRRAVQAAARASPPAASSDVDRPPPAREKYLADWREGPLLNIPPDAFPHAMGSQAPRATIVLFGDYQEPNTIKADAEIRRILSEREDARYEFRHFPVDQSCNPDLPQTASPLGCLAARAAEVVAFVKGPDTFRRMHEWLMARGPGLTGPVLLEAAPTFGFEGNILAEATEIEEIKTAVLEDINAARALGITSVPMIIINGRLAARWELEGENLLGAMVEEAATGR